MVLTKVAGLAMSIARTSVSRGGSTGRSCCLRQGTIFFAQEREIKILTPLGFPRTLWRSAKEI
jgi:hypothetical protein